MEHISNSIHEALVAQGIANGLAGRPHLRGKKGRGAASDGALSQVKASNPEGGPGYSPIGRQGGERPMGNSGKGRAVNAPAKFTGLRLVHSSRQRVARTSSALPCLALVVSR